MKPDKNTIDKLKAEHGENLHQLESSTGETIIVKSPSRLAYSRFRDASFNEKRRKNALSNLVIDCIVWPDTKAWEAMLDARPGLEDTFASDLVELAGAADAVSRKKL